MAYKRVVLSNNTAFANVHKSTKLKKLLAGTSPTPQHNFLAVMAEVCKKVIIDLLRKEKTPAATNTPPPGNQDHQQQEEAASDCTALSSMEEDTINTIAGENKQAQQSESPTPKCYLLDLPAEMRNEIYMMVLTSPSTIRMTPTGYERPAILNTCKAIRAEAIAVYYYNNKFRISVSQYSPAPFIKLYKVFESINRTLGTNTLVAKKLQLTTEFADDTPHWANLMGYLKYVFEGGRRMFGYSPEHVWKKSGQFGVGLNGTGEKMVVASMVVLCKHMRGNAQWKVVERVLKDQRTLLIAFDRRWAVDREEEAKTKETKEGEAAGQGDVTLADIS